MKDESEATSARAMEPSPMLDPRQLKPSTPAGSIPTTKSDFDALVGDHALHRGALDHPVLERRVVLELGHGQLASQAPCVEHESVRVEHRVLVREPLAVREHAVDLLHV